MECLQKQPLLNTSVNNVSMNATIQAIDTFIQQKKKSYIVAINADVVMKIEKDTYLKEITDQADMVLVDGKPLIWISKIHKRPVKAKISGSDLVPQLCEKAAKSGYTIFIIGGKDGIAEQAKLRLEKQMQDIRIVGTYAPPLGFEKDQQELDKINRMISDVHPDLLIACFGCPKQEKWMAAHDGRVCGVMLGVGAGFDFHAGTIKRAPLWMQEFCMEWLFRIGQDPKRLFPRYLDTNFSFVFYLFREWLKGKNGIDRKHYVSGPISACDKEIPRGKKGRPLRVAMIGHKRIPSREGGVEIVVDELSTRMVKLGCEVDAYNRFGYHVSGKEFDEKRERYYNGVRIFTIPTPSSSSLNAIVYSFLATIRSLFGRYDIIHFHAEGPCTMIWIPKLFGIRVVATIHGLDWQRSKWGNFASKVLRFGEKMAAKHADELIVLSENMKDYFQKEYGRETSYIPNGIICPEHKEINCIKEKYGLEKDEYILFLARIVPEKGLHYLIDAFKDIATDKKLVIAGGSSHSHDYMDQITTMSQEDSRIVMTGFVQGEILEELYSNSYIFVLPSDVEGMAVSLLEAMSYGNCCLVSDIDENMEVVQDKACSFQKGNVEDLKRKLEELLTRPDIVEKYRKESADYICGRFNWDDVVDRTICLYMQKEKGK